MHSKLVTTILLAAVGLYIIQIVVTFLRRHTDLSSDEQISDVEQRTSFGLEPHERNEILYVITGFKSEPPVMVRDEEEQFEVETAKKQSTVKNSTPSIVWDDTLASEAYNLAIKCPSSNQASLLKGVLTVKSYSRSPSMTEMVNEWSTEFKEYYEKLREDTAVTTEDGNEFDDDTDSVDPERIGCAKTRCFMDRISSTILVCTWKPYTEGVIAV